MAFGFRACPPSLTLCVPPRLPDHLLSNEGASAIGGLPAGGGVLPRLLHPRHVPVMLQIPAAAHGCLVWRFLGCQRLFNREKTPRSVYVSQEMRVLLTHLFADNLFGLDDITCLVLKINPHI